MFAASESTNSDGMILRPDRNRTVETLLRTGRGEFVKPVFNIAFTRGKSWFLLSQRHCELQRPNGFEGLAGY
jgi:hypothetical protein